MLSDSCVHQGVLNLLDEVLYQSGAIWFSRRYTLQPGTFRLVLEAELTINTEVIAIDNIQLVQGTCQTQGNSDLNYVLASQIIMCMAPLLHIIYNLSGNICYEHGSIIYHII